jgi:hypothetical protein
MKKVILLFLLISAVKTQAMIVEAPALEALQHTTKLEIVSQTSQIIESITVLKDQLEQYKDMAKSLADGRITEEMITFAFDTAKQCGIMPPSVVLKDFPDLKFNICKEPLPIEKVSLVFSFKKGFSIEKKKETQINIDKLREDNYITSLTTALATRSLDRTKAIEDFTKQMSNQSLSNLAYVNNEIALSQFKELTEIRRLLALILEGQTLDRASSFNETQ